MNIKPIRSVREPLKKPRPLRTSVSEQQLKTVDIKDTVSQKSKDEVLDDLEILNVSISNCAYDEVTVMDIYRMCLILKKRGRDMESEHKEALDRYFCTLRNACREERLDMISRVKLLEVIELRARKWETNENIDNYFKLKLQELEQKKFGDGYNLTPSVSSPTIPFVVANQNLSNSTPNHLAPGEILRSSGKFEKPTKITGKNYFKDEIVIRNSDSGKVNPGTRDRLVQITGPHGDAIEHAKVLVEDTIRRNASPVRDSMASPDLPLDNQPFMKRSLQHSLSVGDASLKEYTTDLTLEQDTLVLKSTNFELMQKAKWILKQYFSGQLDYPEKPGSVTSGNQQPTSENVTNWDLLGKQPLTKKVNHWLHKETGRDSVSPLGSSEDGCLKDGSTSSEQTPSTDLLDFTGRTVSFDPFTMNVTITKNTLVDESDTFSAEECPLPAPIPPPSYNGKYPRAFLLQCAKSQLSHCQPKDYPHICHVCKDIVCQSPVMFDPDKYEEYKANKSPSDMNK